MVVIDSLKAALGAPRNDGMLHFSQHLQHDRHTAIYTRYGYPATNVPWGRMFPLIQGTGVHETIHATMKSLYPKYVAEHPITAKDKALQYSWTGTADAYVEVDSEVWLIDYKTISGAGMSFLGDTPKDDHILQVSAYYHFGPTQNCKTGVLYLPSSPGYSKDWSEPAFLPFEPVPYRDLIERMRQVEEAIIEYEDHDELPDPPNGDWSWKKRGKAYKLEYRPHYTSMFCPWASLLDDPCGCSEQKSIIAATYKDGDLTIAEGYASIVDEIGVPDESKA